MKQNRPKLRFYFYIYLNGVRLEHGCSLTKGNIVLVRKKAYDATHDPVICCV